MLENLGNLGEFIELVEVRTAAASEIVLFDLK